MQFQRDYPDADDPEIEDDEPRVRFLPPDGRREWNPVETWTRAEWACWLGQHEGWTPPRVTQYLDVDRYQYGVGFQRHPKEPYTFFYMPVPAAVPLHASKVPNVLYGGAAGGTKALALDTGIQTPSGLRRFGDLVVGDTVFDEHGQMCHVRWVSPDMIDPRGTYRLIFDDGSEIIAGADHQWWTFTLAERSAQTKRTEAYRANRRAHRASRSLGKRPDVILRNQQTALGYESAPVTGGIRTTADLADTVTILGPRINHAIPLSEAWDTPEVDLPLDPYVLGVWLGDGTTLTGSITTADPEILYGLDRLGWPSHRVPSHRYQHRIHGLSIRLKSMGLLGHKHVPDVYRTASAAQRLALLQGLLDTDGMCAPDGQSSFANTNQHLSETVFDLACSLGLKPTLSRYDAKLNGRVISFVWAVRWTSTLKTFRLSRKLAHLPITTRSTQRYRYLVACERVDDVPVRCIDVDSHSHLFLIGRAGIPTHNSHSTRWDAYRHLLAIPDYSSLLMRRTHGELQRNHTHKAIGECARINDFFQKTVFDLTPSQHLMRVPETRGLLTFGHCQNAGDEETYLGDEYDEFRPDELATFLEQQIVGVAGRLRSVKHGDYGTLRARLVGTTNPGGAGTRWIKDWFIDKSVAADKNPRYRPSDYFFIGAKLYDNPYLMDLDGTYTQYEDRLYAHSPLRRKQLLNGDWTVITGQFFEEWNARLHVGVLHIPEGCKIECWVDWGYDPHPGVCLWVACLPNGRLYVFAEWVFRKTIASKVADRIAAMTRTEICTPQTKFRWNRTIGDPSMWAKDGHTGESYQETFRRHGVSMMKADNDRVLGWGRMRHWLSRHPEGGAWLMFSPDCSYCIRTIPSLVHDESDPDDLDTTGEDHAADPIRYGCMARPTPTTYRYVPLPSIPDSIRTLVDAELLKSSLKTVRPFGKVC